MDERSSQLRNRLVRTIPELEREAREAKAEAAQATKERDRLITINAVLYASLRQIERGLRHGTVTRDTMIDICHDALARF